MQYIIMCGGEYKKWDIPRHFIKIKGETLVERTIRLLRENGVTDIAISSNNPMFNQFGVPVIRHENNYVAIEYNNCLGSWYEAFCLTDEPVCYIFGDVVFSEAAIKTIVKTKTDRVEFFASAPPFDNRYIKKWAEPFALKVQDQEHFHKALKICKQMEDYGFFARKPIMWELWQVIMRTPINVIDYTNYTIINDWTCDIDSPEDAKLIERVME